MKLKALLLTSILLLITFITLFATSQSFGEEQKYKQTFINCTQNVLFQLYIGPNLPVGTITDEIVSNQFTYVEVYPASNKETGKKSIMLSSGEYLIFIIATDLTSNRDVEKSKVIFVTKDREYKLTALIGEQEKYRVSK